MRAVLLTLVVASSALGADVTLSAEPSVALPVSEPQASYFGVGGGAVAGAHLGLGRFFDVGLQLGFVALPAKANAPVLGSTSAVLAGAGLRFHLPYDNRVVPWLDVGAHYVNTGGLSRLNLTLGGGVLFGLTSEGTFFLGPQARLLQVFKLVDEAGYLNRDASVLTLGLTLLIRFPGETVDGDADADGVLDSKDSCPKEPGQAPSGCPLRDADGDLVPDAVDACPHQAGLSAFAGCPDPDPDKDGVHNPADKCPDVAEDRDGFEDSDGCPEVDNDQDGVVDGVDDCPLIAGPASSKGCPDADGDKVRDSEDECPKAPGPLESRGCPSYEKVKVTDSKLEITQKIFFAFGKSDILPKSFGLMDEVVRALGDHVRLCLRIEGHTDAVGSAKKNLQLSDDRARSVREYLVKKGIENTRLNSQGYGPNQPLETNATPEGRERNRRVEFVIVPCVTPSP